jgi:hypothetical protein
VCAARELAPTEQHTQAEDQREQRTRQRRALAAPLEIQRQETERRHRMA